MFWEFQIGLSDFQLIPFRKQSKNQRPFEGSTPLVKKTGEPRGAFIRVRLS